MALARYTFSRLIQGVLLILTVVIITFILIQITPGDPVKTLVGDYPHSTEYEQEMRTKFGLDQPIPVQLFRYLTSVAHFDLGYSFRYKSPVAVVVSERIGATLLLMGGAMVIAAILGVVIGLFSSLRPYSILDNMGTVFSLVGYSIPVFWLGQVLMLVFSIKLGWFPAQGMSSLRENYVGAEHLTDVLKHLFLPVVVLSMRYLAINSRMTRASMLEVMGQDYITTARAKGVSKFTVVVKHAFRNALLPVVTVIGINTGFVLTGSVFIETIFAWPGVGLLTYNAISARDYPILMAVFIMVSAMVLVANFITDVLYAVLDPRIGF